MSGGAPGITILGRVLRPGAWLAKHLASEENEAVRVLATRDLVATDVAAAIDELDALGAHARSARTVKSTVISPNPGGRPLNDAEVTEAAEILARHTGHEGRPFVIVEHRKPDADGRDRTHYHVLYSNIDERGRTIPDHWSYARHEEAAREIEERFGLERGRGAFTGRERDENGRFTDERPRASVNERERSQSRRTGLDPEKIGAAASEAWQQSSTGREFRAALAKRGLVLARGTKKSGALVILDPAGGVHGITRRVRDADGQRVTAAQLRARVADLDTAKLPDVDTARAAIRAVPGIADKTAALAQSHAAARAARRTAGKAANVLDNVRRRTLANNLLSNAIAAPVATGRTARHLRDEDEEEQKRKRGASLGDD